MRKYSSKLKSGKISHEEVRINDLFGMKNSYSAGNQKRKCCKKSCHCRKLFLASQQSAQEVDELKTLVNEFLSQKFSAAGVSSIVRSRSKLRKILWLAAVVVSISFMGYMTLNVLLEYLTYPKMLIREENITPKLQFPAVTLCSLNPMVDTDEKSSIYRLVKLKKFLKSTEVAPANITQRNECYQHPLCQWSWFDEICHCVNHPCLTEFCLADNSTHCACSMNFCDEVKEIRNFNSCTRIRGIKPNRCLCNNSMSYENDLESVPLRDDIDMVESSDESLSQLIRLIQTAKTYDLVDIEEDLMPNVQDLLDYGIKFDNLVASCSFDGDMCFRENFTVLYHPIYGRCYMFNYLGMKPSTDSPIFAYNYGSSSGLRLVLHVRQQNKIDLLSHEIGARVIVHDPYDLPFVAEYGMNLRPHDMSAIEVKQSFLERLSPPYGDCTGDKHELNFKLTKEQRYSILGCQKACRHHYLLKHCNCTRRTYLTGSVFPMKTSKYDFCKRENATENECMQNIISSIERGIIACGCKPPCLETVYSTTVSSSRLNENFYKAVKHIRTFHTVNGKHKIVNATDRNFMVGVKVYYSTFQVARDKEQASYSWETLIANIGGNLGFFMGLTLLTLMEILEFFWDVFMTTIRKYSDTRSDQRVQTFSTAQGTEKT